MDKIILKANAKINLFLEVCEKRPDSYHNIDSVMQSVSLHDVITITKSDTIKLTNDKGLPNDEKNIAFKAARMFFDYTEIIQGAIIDIQKNIPISAGLAGGSSNAAAVLKGLNELYETNLSADTLCALGSRLGADVPFCIRGGTYVTKGIGDIFTPCSKLTDCFLVISKAGEGISTPFAYKEIDQSRPFDFNTYKKSDNLVNALNNGSMVDVCKNMYNAFESIVCPIRPLVDEQKITLIKNGAVTAMMSGSGPSVFGIFTDETNAKKAHEALKAMGCDAHLCIPL